MLKIVQLLSPKIIEKNNTNRTGFKEKNQETEKPFIENLK